MPAAWVAGGAAILGAGASLYSANKQSSAAKDAAQTQADAGKYATDAQTSMFNTINNQQAPWRDAGGKAVTSLSDMTQPGGSLMHSFDANDLKSNLAPNYQFMLNQGLGATNNQASVSGGLVSGNALKGVNDYAQNYASNGYQDAFNNYNTNQNNIFNRLSNIAGLGQTANGQTAGAGTATAGNIGNIATSIAGNIGSAQLYGGAAQASGANGAAHAINNAAGWYMANNKPAPAVAGNSTVAPDAYDTSLAQ